MEIVIAVVRMEGEKVDKMNGNAFEVLLVNEPCSSSRHEIRMQLPRCHLSPRGDPAETALTFVQYHCRKWPRRTFEVPLWGDSNLMMQNRSPYNESAQLALYCIPLTENEDGFTKLTKIGHFEALSSVSKHCQTDPECFSVETCHCILQLESWLHHQHCKDTNFLSRFFLLPAAKIRIRQCAHNPAYEHEHSSLCHKRIMDYDRNPSSTKKSCDLAEEVRRSNYARAKMMGYEKYDMFIINPLFGTGLHCGNTNELHYYAKGVTLRKSVSSSSSSSAECWSEKYPLHRAAHDNNVDDIRRLLAQGMAANEKDNASWTPLHYSVFYNNLRAAEALLLHQGTDVNASNKVGSTALHFAVLQGSVYMVELLLSHSKINVDAKDSSGRRPIDVCACVPKREYQKVAKLLLNWKRLNKIQVELMDGGSAQLLLTHGQETTAAELHAEMCKELKFNSDSGKLFAMWICSDRLSLQLKADHKPMLHMSKWKSKITKFGNEEIQSNDGDAPKIFFRRDARLTLQKEKMAALTPMALSLLYDECRLNYLKGLYPCSDHDLTSLAAIMLHVIYGAHIQLTEQMLASVIPIHRWPGTGSNLKQMRSRIESEHQARKRTNLIKLQQEFLQICWRFSVYGATFFDAIAFMNKPAKLSIPVHAGVNDYGLHLINAQTKILFHSCPLKSLTWVMKTDRPYIQIYAKPGVDLTLSTPQASHINSLLTRLRSAAE
ncbi:Ankyrin repeats (many copies) family protein [Acanthocheilonema viteae]